MTHAAPGKSIGFLLVPNFSMVGFLCAVSAFRNANRHIGSEFYNVRIVSDGGSTIAASVGITIAADSGLEQDPGLDLVFVCAGENPDWYFNRRIGGWLRRLARRGTALGSISTGTDILARAGLLEGYRCTIYWERAASFREEFPDIELTDRIYEVDRARYTCGGATSSIDLALKIIADDLGSRIAAFVSATFVMDRVRDEEHRQTRDRTIDLTSPPPAVQSSILAMERHIEHPLALSEIARIAGISERQLNRLFRTHMDITPGDYYKALRLDRARHYLRQTRLSVSEIALACGFRSPTGFAVSYRRRFGLSPRDDRLGG